MRALRRPVYSRPFPVPRYPFPFPLFIPSLHLADGLVVFARVLRVEDGRDKDGLAHHELVGKVPCLPVLREVGDNRTHEAAASLRRIRRDRVDVGHKAVAQLDRPDERVVHRFARLAIEVDFARNVGAVRAHHREERAELHPADIELAPVGVVDAAAIVVAPGEKAAEIAVEVGVAGHGIVEPAWNLAPEDIPVGPDVAGPNARRVALLAECRAARQDEDAPVGLLAHVLVDGARALERIGRAHLAPRAAERGLVLEVALLVVVVGIGRVHPPSVDAEIVQAVEMLPVDAARLGGVVVVELDFRWIVHARRPLIQARLRPRDEREEVVLRRQFAIGLR